VRAALRTSAVVLFVVWCHCSRRLIPRRVTLVAMDAVGVPATMAGQRATRAARDVEVAWWPCAMLPQPAARG
jgi:hypothetical protein